MFWDNLVSVANRLKTKACIYGNTHLDQQCRKRKQLLKMSINFWNNQVEKTKVAVLQTKANFLIPNRSNLSKKARKKKLKKNESKKSKPRKTLKKLALLQPSLKKKKQNISGITCYRCNKKSHYVKNCTKRKNLLQSWQSLRQ